MWVLAHCLVYFSGGHSGSLITLEEAEQWDFVASAKSVDEGCFTQRNGGKKKENRPQVENNNGNFHFIIADYFDSV